MHNKLSISWLYRYDWIFYWSNLAILISLSPGQCIELQRIDSEDGPEQILPPCAGSGLLQDLGRYFKPPLQVLLQVPYAPQFPHPPGTIVWNKKIISWNKRFSCFVHCLILFWKTILKFLTWAWFLGGARNGSLVDVIASTAKFMFSPLSSNLRFSTRFGTKTTGLGASCFILPFIPLTVH